MPAVIFGSEYPCGSSEIHWQIQFPPHLQHMIMIQCYTIYEYHDMEECRFKIKEAF